jgi:hypothetical protein
LFAGQELHILTTLGLCRSFCLIEEVSNIDKPPCKMNYTEPNTCLWIMSIRWDMDLDHLIVLDTLHIVLVRMNWLLSVFIFGLSTSEDFDSFSLVYLSIGRTVH